MACCDRCGDTDGEWVIEGGKPVHKPCLGCGGKPK